MHQSTASHEGQPCQNAGHCSNVHSDLQMNGLSKLKQPEGPATALPPLFDLL